MAREPKIWNIPEVLAGGEAFATLLGTYRPDATTTGSDRNLSAHVYLLGEDVQDNQRPHCEAEFYYVLRGSRAFEYGRGDEARSITVQAGDLIYVPAQVPHRFIGASAISLLVIFGPDFTGPQPSDVCQPKVLAGMVVYRREGNELVGKWCHQTTGGMLAREVVSGVAPGAVEGQWPVQIFNTDNSPMYSGTLKSQRLSDGLKLEWNGTFANGSTGKFIGIGQILNSDLLVGTFEPA